MALTQNQRDEIISYLTTNCPCWKGEDDADVLANFSDEKLQQLKETSVVANVAVKGFSDQNGNAYRVNPQTNTWQHQTLAKLEEQDNNKKPAKKAPVANTLPEELEENEEDCEDEEMEYNQKPKKKAAPLPATTNKRGKTQTQEEIIRNLPPEFQANVQRWQEMERRKKEEIIEEILTNSEVAASDKPLQYERLIKYSVDELTNTLTLIPKRITKDKGAKPVTTRRPRVDDGVEDMLTVPTINWGDNVNPTSSNVIAVDNTDLDQDDDDVEYFEVLKSLPPSVRARIQNAEAIENREKAKLIDQLTENIVDEEVEKKLRQRLSTKTVAELKDLQELNPSRGNGGNKPNYYGAAGAISNTGGHGAGADDVLLPPTIDWSKNGN